jgi:hypothetical protein
MHDPAEAGSLPDSASGGDLSTLTVRVAGAAVVNDVIGHCRPSSKGGVDQFGDYGTLDTSESGHTEPLPLQRLGYSQHSTGSLVPDFSKSGTGTGERLRFRTNRGRPRTGERHGPRPRTNRGRRSRPRPRANRGRGRGRGRGPGCPRPGSGSLTRRCNFGAHARAAFASFGSHWHRIHKLSICNAAPYRACIGDQEYQMGDGFLKAAP